MATEIKKIISRRDTAAKWEANNPILAQGEIGADTTNKVMKIGDGVTPWKSLKCVGGVEIVNDLTTGGADKALSAEMGKELATTRRSGLTDSPELNKLLLELYIDHTSYPTGKTWEDISKVALSKGYNVSNEYINSLYVYFGETVIQVFRDSFSTLEDAISNVIGVRGSKHKAYIDFSTVPVKNGQYTYDVQFNICPVLESAPMIYTYIKSQEFEVDIEQNKADIEQNKVDIDEIQEKLASVPEINYTLSDFVDGYYIVSNKVGALPSSPVAIAGYAYKYIDVREGEKWDMHLVGGSNGRAWALLDINGKIVEFSQDTGNKDYSVVIPEGVVSMLVQTSYSNSSKDSIFVIREAVLSEVDKKIQELKADIEQSRTLKILCFGNSFTQDSMSYVPAIMKNVVPHVNLTIGMAVIGGCPLIQHLVNFTGTSLTLDDVTYSVQNYSYQKSVNGGSWKSVSTNVDTMLSDEGWDIITFQQNGVTAHKDYDTYYAPYIYPLLKALFNKVNRAIKVGWLSIHGTYASTDQALLSNWEGVVANTQRVLDTSGVSVVFPFGTAVQNLRTVDEVNALGDTGHLLADGGHLQDGIGCLCAAYCNTLKILEMLGIGNVGVIGEPTRITSQFISDNNIQGTNLGTSGSIIGMEEDYVYLAQVAAECAVKKPYEVTDLTQVEV